MSSSLWYWNLHPNEPFQTKKIFQHHHRISCVIWSDVKIYDNSCCQETSSAPRRENEKKYRLYIQLKWDQYIHHVYIYNLIIGFGCLGRCHSKLMPLLYKCWGWNSTIMVANRFYFSFCSSYIFFFSIQFHFEQFLLSIRII